MKETNDMNPQTQTNIEKSFQDINNNLLAIRSHLFMLVSHEDNDDIQYHCTALVRENCKFLNNEVIHFVKLISAGLAETPKVMGEPK